MFLSIIIPHYNLPRELLERCLHSIISLGLPADEYEVIIVDDGSDNAPTWATSLQSNITLKVAQHGGPGHARNVGIEHATGTYIIFVDADDCLTGNKEIFNCIEKLKSERPQILRYRYEVVKESSTPASPKKKNTRFSNTISGATYMKDYNLSGSSCIFFFQRELAVKKGITFPTGTFHEDEEFNTIIHYHAQTLIDSDAVLYSYCTRSGSTTANKSETFEKQRIENLLHIIERIHRFAKTNSNTSNAIQAKAITHKLDMLTVDAILNMLFIGMSAKETRKKCTEILSPIGLYPLRKASYSLKYRIFRSLANSRLGMALLRMAVPAKKPAKR